jgi:plastocyanin
MTLHSAQWTLLALSEAGTATNFDQMTHTCFRRLDPWCVSVAALILFDLAYVEPTVPAVPQASDVVTVKMTAEHKFLPEKMTIQVGQTVEWVNEEEGGIHQVTTDQDVAVDPSDVSIPEGAGPFDSHLIKSGKSFRHQFTVPGVYKYACPPHESAGMLGEMTVKK